MQTLYGKRVAKCFLIFLLDRVLLAKFYEPLLSKSLDLGRIREHLNAKMRDHVVSIDINNEIPNKHRLIGGCNLGAKYYL